MDKESQCAVFLENEDALLLVNFIEVIKAIFKEENHKFLFSLKLQQNQKQKFFLKIQLNWRILLINQFDHEFS